MRSDFIRKLTNLTEINDYEKRVLTAAAIASAEELLALVWSFPSIANVGCNVARLSFAATKLAGPGFVAAAKRSGAAKGTPPPFASGAIPPTASSKQPGYPVPLVPTSPPNPPRVPPNAPKLDFRLPSWPVRDQGTRGTCVAFAVAACREYRAQRPDLDLAEQYLYWAIKKKTGDKLPHVDGTHLEFGGEALQRIGVCERSHWPYNRQTTAGDVTQETLHHPTARAHRDAAKWRMPCNSLSWSNPSQGAQKLLHALQATSAPVAISVAQFVHPPNTQSTNWNWQPALDGGRVLDPLPTMVVESAHAVCVTGFHPDDFAPGGGWFIFRNSWGTSKWSTNPANPYVAPEPGYGQISAAYVDDYLYEICTV